MLKRDFFQTSPLECARKLIGCELRWNGCAGLVVETEAYAEKGDAACHTFFKKGARTFVESNAAGSAYIYLNYGIHWMLNVLVKNDREAGFVLIRALEPTEGIAAMRYRRPKVLKPEGLCSGPGKLARAFGIDRTFHGQDMTTDPAYGFYLKSGTLAEVITDVRVGIARAADFPWRFLLSGSPHVSVAHGKVRLYPRRANHGRDSSGVKVRKKTKSQAG